MVNGDLRAAVKGRVLLPGEDGFDEASKPWNLAVEQPVAAVVEAADAADVAALVRYARRAGVAVTAQPSGHGASGWAREAILLRTARLDGVEVDPQTRVARAGAGVRWGRVQSVAGAHGLTGLAGSSPVVSVAGFTLGGGLSWFSRKYGFASENVRAFDIVDSEGNQARVTAETDPELFWALRGGGGDYALVTAIEFELHPAPSLYGGRMLWPDHRAGEVFAAFRELTAEAPPELSVWISRMRFPGAPPMVAVDLTYLGDPEEVRAPLGRLDKIGDLAVDKRGMVAVADLGDITAEPTDPAPVLPRSELLTGLDERAVEILLADPLDPLVAVQVRHMGGALAAPGTGASGRVGEPYLLYTLGLALNPELSAAVRGRREELLGELHGYLGGRKPYTFLAPGERAEAAFPPASLARLRELKRARDPHGVFRANFPVLE